MKSIYFLATVTIASLFVTGCGDDRSHGDSSISSYGKKSRWIYDTDSGKKMVENNFVYIPGGFDVDGDGKIESGFWLAKYEARDGGSVNKTATVDKEFVSKSFNLYDPISKKFDATLDKKIFTNLNGLTQKIVFNDKDNVINNITPSEAVAIVQNSQIDGGYSFSLVSEKQWMHLAKLITKNSKNWTDAEVGKGKLYQGLTKDEDDRRYFEISNSLFETSDDNVPKDYSVKVYDLSGNYAEWTSGVVKLIVDSNKPWGNVSGLGSGGFKALSQDSYAIVARGGSKNDLKSFTGIDAKEEHKLSDRDISVGFRGASKYLY